MKFQLTELIEHIDKSIYNANNNVSKLPNYILDMEGMSGKKTRHLYNNICSLFNANYLEIGTWAGSSFISSLYGNNINAIAIDNWSEFNGQKNTFINNVRNFCPNKTYNFIEKDCFSIGDAEILNIYDGIDIFLYDGAHDYESHKKAITKYKHLFSELVIIIIDDFRNDTSAWADVSIGTYDGLNESKLIIHKKIEMQSKQELNGAHEYWNGFGLFICQQPLP